ncbi:MAG: adenine deaminase [Chloroflexi bacterium]|nr:adenine deaminase [Chloroflexota bacterium]
MTLVQAALGKIKLDTLIQNVRLANVITGEIYQADIGIYRGQIAMVEPPGTQPPREAAEVIDGGGRLAVPGLIDSHLHIESTLVTPAHFAEGVLPRGTTTVAEDPHEIGNAMGLPGIRLFWEASQNIPLKVLYLVSTCVPAAKSLETAGGEIGPEEAREMLTWEGVIGLAEVMDMHAVIGEWPHIAGILAEGKKARGVIEGHNPVLRGRELNAYIAAGVDSDHTLATPDTLREKMRLGVTVQLQERYLSREVIEAVTSLPFEPDVCLVTDDVAPDYLEDRGHLDQVLRKAIALGMPPMLALRAVTIKAARRMRLYDRGAIRPGLAADIVLVDSIEAFKVDTVLVDGQTVVRGGKLLWHATNQNKPLAAAHGTVKLPLLDAEDFAIAAPVQTGSVRARVILSDKQGTTTRLTEETVEARDGLVALPPGDDLAYIAVFARYGHNNGRGFGLLRGLGLTAGAVATTYAHDAHNLCVIGRDLRDMATAANAVISAGGGMAVVRDGQVTALIELPIAGIISPHPVSVAAAQVRRFTEAIAAVGVVHPALLMRLSTYTLSVSAGLRITDHGLVNANTREPVSLFA